MSVEVGPTPPPFCNVMSISFLSFFFDQPRPHRLKATVVFLSSLLFVTLLREHSLISFSSYCTRPRLKIGAAVNCGEEKAESCRHIHSWQSLCARTSLHPGNCSFPIGSFFLSLSNKLTHSFLAISVCAYFSPPRLISCRLIAIAARSDQSDALIFHPLFLSLFHYICSSPIGLAHSTRRFQLGQDCNFVERLLTPTIASLIRVLYT